MGTHYKKIKEVYGFEPIELIDLLDLSFRMSNFIKYILRRNFKDQYESDLAKALDCLVEEVKPRKRRVPELQEDKDHLMRMLSELREHDLVAWRILDAAIFQKDTERARELIIKELNYVVK